MALEVAYDGDLDLKTSSTFAIIAAPKAEIDPTRITLDPTDRKLLMDGKPLERGYCVFSIRRATEKADFGEIPELRDKYEAVIAGIKSNNAQVANDALTVFRLAAETSPDLIPADIDFVVARAARKVTRAFTPHPASPGLLDAVHGTLSAKEPGDTFADIGLYDPR